MKELPDGTLLKDPDYDLLPPHMIQGVKDYIEEGIMPGDFLKAVFSNNLVEAYARADSINTACMKNYAEFLYNEVPMDCWGSKKKMEAWVKKWKRG